MRCEALMTQRKRDLLPIVEELVSSVLLQDNLKNKCGSSSHQSMKEKEKHHLDKIQGIFINLQSSRKENRYKDIVMFEEQMHQLLREWKAELESPATSLAEGSLGSFPGELAQLLQELEENDDAISPLEKPETLKTQLHPHTVHDVNYPSFHEKSFDDSHMLHDTFEGFGQFDGPASTLQSDTSDMITQLDSHTLVIEEGFDYGQFFENEAKQCEEDTMPNVLPNICPPPSAFLGPKCSLWDCFRPAQGLQICQDYCSSGHELLANNEGLPGMTPILRPGGIGVKDGPLFAALLAKTQGKEVGIPKCEGAASTKSPWKAPELFDLSFLEGETLREWLFFDQPRRAFVSGNRKQRSLPDYNGRGWHESRKQVMKEHGGHKRSYYMDPQPLSYLEWHLYEYEINNQDSLALYRLELKFVDNKKKSPKAKLTKESLADLQNKMGKLSADVLGDDGGTADGKIKAKSENGGSPEHETKNPE
ncbi:hypothetical protein Ahy_B08g093410 isoform A [Arachis hypogaea]|uniref:Transcription factor VOZ1 n=1 Tax=Arachis hypogaea TaxID=3818 RepID=A0A444Y645_ARAHY|nr:hypothetical protein Ahy_B08g093410 isoform A [Arachis hypogaea]